MGKSCTLHGSIPWPVQMQPGKPDSRPKLRCPHRPRRDPSALVCPRQCRDHAQKTSRRAISQRLRDQPTGQGQPGGLQIQLRPASPRESVGKYAPDHDLPSLCRLGVSHGGGGTGCRLGSISYHLCVWVHSEHNEWQGEDVWRRLLVGAGWALGNVLFDRVEDAVRATSTRLGEKLSISMDVPARCWNHRIAIACKVEEYGIVLRETTPKHQQRVPNCAD